MLSEIGTVLGDVKSFGPETGKALLIVLTSVNERLRKGGMTPEMETTLTQYRDHLQGALHFGAIHQSIVIRRLEELLHDSGGAKS